MEKINFKQYFSCDYPGYKTFEKEVLIPIFGDYYQPEDMAENYIANDEEKEKAKKANIKDIYRMATIAPNNGNALFNTIEVFDITVFDNSKLSRSRVAIQQFIRSKNFGHNHVLMLFHYENPTGRSWRFSYFYKEDTLQETTSARRYTYLFGKKEKVRTANQRFNKLFETLHKKNYIATDEDIENAFSVEKLSDEFFEKYLAFYVSFVKFITSKKESKEAIKKECFQRTLKQIASLGKKDTYDQYNKYFMPKYKDEETCDKMVRDYVKKMMGRLVFLHFLQRKEWMCGDRDFMHHLFLNSKHQDDFLDRVLEPLFFAVLNTQPDKRKLVCQKHNDYPYNKDQRVDWEEKLIEQWETIPYLNGGLFEQEKIDECRTIFPKEYFEALFNFFDEYNFTIDENDPYDAIVGVDPEMLSKIFENLLEDNKDKGAFYTPKTIVHYMCTESLIAYLKEKCKDVSIKDSDLRKFVLEPHTYIVDDLKDEQRACLTNALKNVHVCDPAIGSGAFPMGMLNAIYACRHELEPEIPSFDIKLHIIQNNIFGVDIEQGAVDIARLRFWLSLVVEEQQPHPLPNLDYRIVRGNSLLTTFKDEYVNLDSDSGRAKVAKMKKELAKMQKEYYSLNGEEKLEKEVEIKQLILNILEAQLNIDRKAAKQKEITEEVDFYNPEIVSEKAKKLSNEAKQIAAQKQNLISEIEKKRNILTSTNRDLFDKARTDIEFFDWKIIFSDVFDNNNGFDIVIGNPPYLRIQGIRENDPVFADNLCKTFLSTTGKFDLYVPFIEKGLELSLNYGIVNFIMPTKWTNSDYGCGIRNVILQNMISVRMINFSSYQVFNASTYTGIQWFYKSKDKQLEYIQLDHDLESANELNNYLEGLKSNDYAQIGLNSFTIKPWKLASNKATSDIIVKITKFPKLSSILSYLSQGIVSVGDDIFVMEGHFENNLFFGFSNEIGKEVCLEASIVKPLLKGEDVKRYSLAKATHYVIYPHHNLNGKTVPYTETEMKVLFPKTYAYMLQFKNKLIEKKIKYKTNPTYWYSLHRSREINMFEKDKILTPEISYGCNMSLDCKYLYHNTQNYTLQPKGEYSVFTKSILGILNSKLFWFYISNTGTILRGGYFRFKTKYIESFPIPINALNSSNCIKIGKFVSEILSSKETDSSADTSAQEQEIDRLVYKLYGLTYDEVKIVDPDTPITEEEYNKD